MKFAEMCKPLGFDHSYGVKDCNFQAIDEILNSTIFV